MVNTKMFEFKHPKYYTELRKLRNKEARRVQGCLPTNELHNSDQAISDTSSTEASERASDPGQSIKQQASSSKPQAPSNKPQAPSDSKISEQDS
jgi:hypothetical protein